MRLRDLALKYNVRIVRIGTERNSVPVRKRMYVTACSGHFWNEPLAEGARFRFEWYKNYSKSTIVGTVKLTFPYVHHRYAAERAWKRILLAKNHRRRLVNIITVGS